MVDLRYKLVKRLIEYNEINTWKDICKNIPVSVMREMVHVSHYRMRRIYDDPSELQYKEVAILAEAIGVEHRVISELIEMHLKEAKRKA